MGDGRWQYERDVPLVRVDGDAAVELGSPHWAEG